MRAIHQSSLAWLTARFERVPPQLKPDESFADLVFRMKDADDALRHLARVVNGAVAPERFDVMPESPGLRAMIEGIEASGDDRERMSTRAADVYDALLASLRLRIAAGSPLESDPLFDPISGLPNRLLFLDRIGQAVAYAHRHDMLLGICSVRIDMSEAAPAAGRILIEIAARLRDAVRRELDTVARLGFDEFGLVLNDLRTRENALVALGKIEKAFEQPFDVRSRSYILEPRIGLAFYPSHGHDAGMLLGAAREAAAEGFRLAIFGEP